MGDIRSGGAALLLFLPAIVWAAEDKDVSLSSILTKGFERPAIVDAAGRDFGGLLVTIAGVDSLPIACGTPLTLLLTRPDAPLPPGLQQAAAIIAARPVLDSAKVSFTRDGLFAIHYPGQPSTSGLLAVDRDRNGLPDLVDRVAEALQASRSSLVARLGYPAPSPDGERLDVFLLELGHGLEGFVVPRLAAAPASGEAAQGGPPFMVLDAGLSSDRVLPATLHQMAHLAFLSLTPRASRFWGEASASYLTLQVTGDLKAHEAALRARLQSPGRGLASDGLLLMEGGLLWPQFLAEQAGDPSIVKQIWEEMAAQGLDPLAATDAALRRSGRGLADAVREYAAWNLFTGDRDDGQHYSSGRALPTAAMASVGPETPFLVEPAEPVDPLAAIAFRLPGQGGHGAIDLEVTAEGGHPGADLLVFYRPWGPQPVLVPVIFDASGGARVLVPWTDAREAWMILRNDALPGGGSTRFEAHAVSDPYAPYDLASFNASEMGTTILVEWTTASEKELQAWNVLRSETPDGPFTRLNSVAVPAVGESASDTGYIFVDDIARPGRRYYYLLEGLTGLGLPQRSHVVSGRIGPAR